MFIYDSNTCLGMAILCMEVYFYLLSYNVCRQFDYSTLAFIVLRRLT